ncbi:MAG: DUF1236 domain-containing protein [Xanthobacteraceae bacterium]
MTKSQNILLAGVAALALAAGTGVASAQAPSGGSATQEPHTTPGHGVQQHGTGSGVQGQGQTGGALGKGQASPQHNAIVPGPTGPTGAQNATGTGTGTGTGNPQAQGTEPGRKQHHPQGTAQGDRGGPGPQGSASGQVQGQHQGASGSTNGGQASVQGSSVKLSQQQRSRIRTRIVNAHNAPRADHVTFGVNVGTVIPRDQFTTIHVVRVPEYLVSIEPRWRGLEYFIYSDEIVIVDPHDLRIVAIIPA